MVHSGDVHTHYPQSRQWSNRILILSLSGIFFLTLYPFHFDLSARVAGNWSPFLLDVSHKSAGFADAFLNILLFIPFGLGLASFLRRRNYSWSAIFSAALLVGALCSYFIEFLQIYIPTRDSGWEDVFTNTAGSFAGALLFKTLGEYLLAHFSRWEQAAEAWCSTTLIAFLILLYFGLWCAISVPLQRETRFTNWDPACPIYIGEDAAGKNAWKGRVTLLKIWNRPWHGDAGQLTAPAGGNSAGNPGLLAAYNLTGAPPYESGNASIPPLVPLIHLGPTGSPWFQASGDFTRLTTALPAAGLIRELQKTNQLSLRLDFLPLGTDSAEGDILSLSKPHGVDDLFIWQEGRDLFIYIRSPLASRGTRLRWEIHDLIVPNQPVSVLISYDGSSASIFVNGRKRSGAYYLSPGAGIMRRFIHINAYELSAYSIIYASLIFVPIGILLGMAARKLTSLGLHAWAGLWLTAFLLPAILEALLVFVSGRAVIPSLITLGAFLTIAGFLWFNADRSEAVAQEYAPA